MPDLKILPTAGTRFSMSFDEVGVKFGLEVHPTEIAFDIVTAERAIEAVNGREAFGFNYDPSHLGYQGVDYVAFLERLSDRIYHVPHEGCLVVRYTEVIGCVRRTLELR